MDEATLRFFEELGEKMVVLHDNGWWDVVEVDDINDLLAKHLPLLRYHDRGASPIYGAGDGWELRIGGKGE